MPAPGTRFIWDDQSQINPIDNTIKVTIDRPINFSAFSSDKGPEEFTKIESAQEFADYYGNNIDFSRHGQSLLTATSFVKAGGRLFARRVVAEDAKLANIAVIANVTKTNIQKTDENGKALYRDNATGEETTSSVASTPIMTQVADLEFTLQSVDMVSNNPGDYKTALKASHTHNGLGKDGSYPLFLFTDIGRGVSNKRIRIYRNNTTKYPIVYASYILKIMEENQDGTLTELETFMFSLNPDIRDSGLNMSLTRVVNAKTSRQIRTRIFEEYWEEFYKNLAYISGRDEKEMALCDLLYNTDLYGKKMSNIRVKSTSVNLNNLNGISLLNGSNGRFGTNPMANLEYYYKQIQMVFNGSCEQGDAIYDVDNNRIDVIFDCNYPAAIKRSIEELVAFREDCEYFEDMGTKGLMSFQDIKYQVSKLPESARSKFVMLYSNYWDILDPYSGKQITVTSTYNMAVKFVNHYLNGVSRPFCGQAYGIVFDDVIDGTINFTPKHTPKSGDQKQFFDDNRINYATYYDGVLTMDSEFTAQRAYTQLSWGNNVLMVQALIREIRQRCPINRYKFLDGDDLVQYKQDVESIIARHSSKFETIQVIYTKDLNYDMNKIFYARIQVTFRNFIQTEIFKIEAIRNSENAVL